MYDYICMIIYVYVKNTNPITYICTYPFSNLQPITRL